MWIMLFNKEKNYSVVENIEDTGQSSEEWMSQQIQRKGTVQCLDKLQKTKELSTSTGLG